MVEEYIFRFDGGSNIGNGNIVDGVCVNADVLETSECLIEYASLTERRVLESLIGDSCNKDAPGSAITSSSGRPFFDHLSTWKPRDQD